MDIIDESLVLELLTDLFGRSYKLDLILIGLLFISIILVSVLSSNSKVKSMVVKYIYLAEQVMFEDPNGQAKFDFAMDKVTGYLDSKSLILKWAFKILFNKKVLTRMINKTVEKEKTNLQMIKKSNNEIANKSAQLFEQKVFDIMPEGKDKEHAMNIMDTIKQNDFSSDNTISAFAEIRTDFRDKTELRAGGSINIKL